MKQVRIIHCRDVCFSLIAQRDMHVCSIEEIEMSYVTIRMLVNQN